MLAEEYILIAMATLTKADVLVSWNFKHIVNLDKIRGYNGINYQLGHNMIEIRTPKESSIMTTQTFNTQQERGYLDKLLADKEKSLHNKGVPGDLHLPPLCRFLLIAYCLDKCISHLFHYK